LHPQWFETFFQGVAVEFWNHVVPSAVTLAEVDFLERTLAPSPGTRLLDIPCGNGRHSVELARRRYRMTGVDLSTEFLTVAESKAQHAQVEMDLRPGDMRNLELPAAGFDGAFCLGNSFPYLDRKAIGAFLSALHRALLLGSKLVIDTGCAAESILPELIRRRWHRVDDIVLVSDATYLADESRLEVEYTFVHKGKIETRPASSYVFTVAELTRMLFEEGFYVSSLHGGVAGECFELGTPRLLLAAERMSSSKAVANIKTL
jgi:SAM-dependent methyltransferase